MESANRTIKIVLAAFASVLLVAMLALGGLTATSAGKALAPLMSAAGVAQKAPASDASALKNVSTQPTISDSTSQAAPAQQQGGVVDARAAVKAAGPAVVTIVNKLQAGAGNGSGGFTNPNGNPFTNPFGNGNPFTNPNGNGNGNGNGNPFTNPNGNGTPTVPGQGRGQGQAAPEALGSGIIIDNQGDIVTNQHVVADNQSLEVVFSNGTTVPATLVGQDSYYDLAVIRVNTKVPAVASLGDSSKLELGQPVVAIGTALGDYPNTVTEGIVSGLHRQIPDGGTSTQDLIQTDAAINHGNSGGPLLDLNGNVVGVNVAVVRNAGASGDAAEGLGFSIPVNTMKNVAAQLIQNGSIKHPFIGITYQVITADLAQQLNLSRQQGVYVSDVTAGSPAAKAGVQPQSIITKFDGVTLTNDPSAPTIRDLLGKHQVGDSVTMSVVAPGSNTEKDVTIVLAERPAGQ